MKDLGTNHDGYHTFNELYVHRHLLFLNLVKYNKNISWKSLYHSDGTMFDDMFIAGIKFDNGLITYHLPMKYWKLCDCFDLTNAPEWDGHTPQDVCDRLLRNL